MTDSWKIEDQVDSDKMWVVNATENTPKTGFDHSAQKNWNILEKKLLLDVCSPWSVAKDCIFVTYEMRLKKILAAFPTFKL